ncbi:Cobalt-zinc-cadmium resistance protein CzcA [Acinetobacter baumannii]|nr:Cobalt-zinc-cadmium resistance protein CzcA [Acinetobacter baumannii]
MPPNISDAVILLKPHDQWPNPKETLSELRSRMEAFLATLPGNNSEFSQPIELRFNELISGIRSDIGVKILATICKYSMSRHRHSLRKYKNFRCYRG